MRYITFMIIEALIIAASMNSNVNLDGIAKWLVGINFTLVVFAINFTFFGYQLSKYKEVYDEVTKRQWLNIIALIALPMLPLLTYLILPKYFSYIALWVLPLIFFSAFDNALLTSQKLDIKKFISDTVKKRRVKAYLEELSRVVENEVQEHESYLENSKHFQIPMHSREFEPVVLGTGSKDLWDSIALSANLAMKNHDYPVFREGIKAALKLVVEFYSFKESANYKLESGMRVIAQHRFRSVVMNIAEKDTNGVFLQSLSKEMCHLLKKDEMKSLPCSDMTRTIASDAVWIGSKMLESNAVVEPIHILNTVHQIVELGMHRLETQVAPNDSDYLEKYSIAVYAYDIKELGVSALNSGNSHFAYRCMETLSYLGCNAAQLKSNSTVTAVLESIVQLGRVARSLKSDCFYKRCLIPFESHAEEFMGHILTWLVHDLDSNGKFFMKAFAEQAYSRLRGLKCAIYPRKNTNPILWIDELQTDNKSIPHVECESGMYGYEGSLDYSNFDNLKEYTLTGVSLSSDVGVIRTPPIRAEVET